METEELIKLVDGIYRNILDKFNPGARQMINAGKAYLKALHGAAAASRMYVDAISKLARQAQQGTWGGSSDIGVALFKIVEVYKEIQDRQMNILKAFYVDLLVPLETNLEKDTKVVQSEQKRFLQQHKQRSETYSKAAASMKKQRKKSRGSSKSGLAMDKELKNMQVLEEEKTKLDAFCEQSLKNAITQERRRYGFVLERQCSLSKHYLAYYTHGVEAYQENIDAWSDVAKTREYLPESVENIFSTKLRQISVWQNEDLYSNPRSPNLEEDRTSITSQLRKTKSMDASCLDIRSIEDVSSPVNTLNRAKSDYNLTSSTNSVAQERGTPMRRPKSIAVPPPPSWDFQMARALYAYLSSGENQLSFHEGDVIALMGERNKGWQFGENLRTQCSGWFPLAYTEIVEEPTMSPTHRNEDNEFFPHRNHQTIPSNENKLMVPNSTGSPSGNDNVETPSTRMFGDTLHLHRSSINANKTRRAIDSSKIPPPTLPAPVPNPAQPRTPSQSTDFISKANLDAPIFSSPYSATAKSSSHNHSSHPLSSRTEKSAGNPLPLHLQVKGAKMGAPVGNASLYSSNDSGFSNDPPPQPEVDYSDDDSVLGHYKLSSRRRILKQLDQEQKADTQLRRNNTTITRTRDSKISEAVPPQKKANSIKQSKSHTNLVENRFHMTDDVDILTKERKKVKRTKSFWKFGKSDSDNEILEGMALWKHRDLVDLDAEAINAAKKAQKDPARKPSRDKSVDSDKTINNNQNDSIPSNLNENHIEIRPLKSDSKWRSESPKKSLDEDIEYRETYSKKQTNLNNFEDQFYGDEGDGLMLKTLNRKNILRQYTNNSSGTDSESESEMTSDDPYDSILVDDQKVQKIENQFPNVAELGKKLEKLSKTSKYSPEKDNNNDMRNIEQMKNFKNRKTEKNQKNLKTFGVEVQNNENGEKETIDDERFYIESDIKHLQDKNKYHNNLKNDNSYRMSTENKRKSDNRRNVDKRMDYDSSKEELQDPTESKQLLPRTKLAKSNSYNSQSKYDPEDLLEYGETLQRRLKNPEYNSKFDDKSPHSGNMYGPWYDLWGLDSTGMARKK